MDDEINLLEQLGVIIQHKRIVLVTLCVVVAVSFVCNLFDYVRYQKVYQATVSIMSSDSSSGLAGALSSVGIFQGKSGGSEGKLLPIVKSQSLAMQVADRIKQQGGLPGSEGKSQAPDDLAAALRGAVDFKADKDLYLLSAQWSDPKIAAYLANLYVDELGLFLNKKAIGINFQVLDPATVPTKPVNRFGFINKILVAVLFGLFLGIFFAFCLEFYKKINWRGYNN